jgi:hypothetical protein
MASVYILFFALTLYVKPASLGNHVFPLTLEPHVFFPSIVTGGKQVSQADKVVVEVSAGLLSYILSQLLNTRTELKRSKKK